MNEYQSNSKTSFAIYHDLIIKSSLVKVFEAISEPDHLVKWWPLRCSGNPKLGNKYNFYFTPEYDWYGRVVQFSKNKTFHIKMTDSDSDWNPTTFGFDLSKENGNVKVGFQHTGWPVCNAHFKRSSYCWAMLLSGLKNYVEKGIVVPYEERE